MSPQTAFWLWTGLTVRFGVRTRSSCKAGSLGRRISPGWPGPLVAVLKGNPMQVLVGNLVLTCLLSAAADAGRGGAEALDYWPQWRGPLGTGVAPNAQPPVAWGENRHVRWKTALPGKGHST